MNKFDVLMKAVSLKVKKIFLPKNINFLFPVEVVLAEIVT